MRTGTSETEAGEGILGSAAELHADTLHDVSGSGIYRIKGVGDVFARRVEHGIVKPGERPGNNVDLNIKGLDKNNMARSGDVMVHKKETAAARQGRRGSVPG